MDEYVCETPATAFYQLGGYNRILKGQNIPGALLPSVGSETNGKEFSGNLLLPNFASVAMLKH